jgi:predicted DNA-binding ribbon-helix-helix protein
MIANPHVFEKRSFILNNKDTSIVMERIYWTVIDRIAKKHRLTMRGLVLNILTYKPTNYRSRAGWLRLYVSGYAYRFLTTSPEIHNPPKSRMEWNHAKLAFEFPKKPFLYG